MYIFLFFYNFVLVVLFYVSLCNTDIYTHSEKRLMIKDQKAIIAMPSGIAGLNIKME